MDNKHPKSELPAVKESAAAAKEKQGLQKSIEKEHEHSHQKSPPFPVGKGPLSSTK